MAEIFSGYFPGEWPGRLRPLDWEWLIPPAKKVSQKKFTTETKPETVQIWEAFAVK